jgi:uncharacterized membrane protein
MTAASTRPLGRVALAVLVLLTGLGLLAGYANKARCTGPQYDAWGRSGPDYELRHDRDVCYSDIQHLWLGRDIDRHVFPYVHGGLVIDAGGAARLTGGAVEYPVLTGLLMWAAALPVHTDGGFLLASALLLAPFGLLTGWLLGRLARWRALVWALGPPLVMYAFHNWDLPAVACATAAVAAVHLGRGPLARRGVWAGALLGAGFTLKVYPALFVAPLALYVLTASRPGRRDWRGALRTVGAAVVTALVVNLPFAVAGPTGWWASFEFQRLRLVDMTTNSIWYWGFRPISDPGDTAFQSWVDRVSPTAVLAACAVALAVGWRRHRRSGEPYPWVPVSGAMLCALLLLHKVHSPQYALWLVPFLVLLRVRAGWVLAYLVADLAIGIGVFRYFYHAFRVGQDFEIYNGLAAQAVMVGVWGRAALLVALFRVFLSARTAFDAHPPPPGEPSAPGEHRLLEVRDPGAAPVQRHLPELVEHRGGGGVHGPPEQR